MKLQAKLALFNTLSKLLMILVAALVLPGIINLLALSHADQQLRVKKEKVLGIIDRIGISEFIKSEHDSSFASYNLLKEEFISLEQVAPQPSRQLITEAARNIGDELVNYRVLSYTFSRKGKTYLLEIGRSLEMVQERHDLLQKLAIILLLAVTLLTIFSDLVFARYLLKPLQRIIETKLRDVHHPATFNFEPIETHTLDFRQLDSSINQMMLQIKASFEKEREFMSNVAHELLTPISILQNRFENLLSEENLSEQTELKLLESQKTLSRLKNVIRSLLLISKIENDQYLKTDEVNIEKLVREVADEVEVRLESKDLRLQIDLQAPLPVLAGNHSLLFTMFFNLVNNAIKYNREKGAIFISGQETGSGYTIEILDTGQGIPQEALPVIFSRFNRASLTHQHDSYGLGLPIVQTIANFHEIKIGVRSEMNKGTVFTLLFPRV
jgi:signal transduction histidine kinase